MADLRLVPSEERRLAIQEERIDELRRLTESIEQRGLQHAERLLLPSEHPNVHPDADKAAAFMTTRTKFAMEIYREKRKADREKAADVRALGIIVVKETMAAADWEKKAQAVDTPIDVEAK